MARQVITITKFVLGIDSGLDAVFKRIQGPEQLTALVSPQATGRGLLYWASYLDPWLTFDLFQTETLGIPTSDVCDGVISLDLLSPKWNPLLSDSLAQSEWEEQDWLLYHLRAGFESFQDENTRATLLLGRQVLGASLGDDELLSPSS